MRFDSGYWSNKTIDTLARLGVSYTMAVRASTKALAKVIAEIPAGQWVRIAYPEGGDSRGRVYLQGTTTRGAAHQADRSPGHALARLASLRNPD